MKRNFLALFIIAIMAVSVIACSESNQYKDSTDNTNTEKSDNKEDFSVGMVTDTGGVSDKSFNELAWKGLKKAEDESGVQISYLESTQESDYAVNLEKQVDENKDLIWGVGFAMADVVKKVAEMNEEIYFGIIDNVYEDIPENVACLSFSGQQPSFLVGYVAALTTKTDEVGFVGGIKSDVISQFEYGYRAGVKYASKELDKEIKMNIQYADSFIDSEKGKVIAISMFSEGCDIIFHAAGGVGSGVLEAAVETDKFAIGVDSDQLNLAPDNVLTSALKKVDVAVSDVTAKLKNGEEIGGQVYNYDLSNGGVGIPSENPNMDVEVYKKTLEVQDKIVSGEVEVPFDEDTFEHFEV